MDSLIDIGRTQRAFMQLKRQIPFQHKGVEATLRYLIYDIRLLNGKLTMTFFKSRHPKSIPSVLRIDHYFSKGQKTQGLPDRSEIFKMVDRIALALGCAFAYIDQDVHRYIVSMNPQVSIPSRQIDMLTGDRTFYQRKWPLSMPSSTDSIMSVLHGRITLDRLTQQTIRNKQDYQRRLSMHLQPSTRDQAIRLRSQLLRNPTQETMATVRSFIQAFRLSQERQLIKLWQDINCNHDFDTVIKFYQ